jgi:hypothetical protein
MGSDGRYYIALFPDIVATYNAIPLLFDSVDSPQEKNTTYQPFRLCTTLHSVFGVFDDIYLHSLSDQYPIDVLS